MEEQNRTVQNFVLGFRSLVVRLVPFERGGTKRAKFFLAMESGIANFSATMVTSGPLREGRDGKCEGRKEKCEFLARKSVSSSPIVRIFGKGKCKFIANFSATMVTSLPSFSVSLSLSLSLTHRKYLNAQPDSDYCTELELKMAIHSKQIALVRLSSGFRQSVSHS